MSDLVGNPDDRFSHNEAHFISGTEAGEVKAFLTHLSNKVLFYQDLFSMCISVMVPANKILQLGSIFIRLCY